MQLHEINLTAQYTVCSVHSLDPSVNQRASWLLILPDDWISDPALSGVRGLNAELKPDNHILLLSLYSAVVYKHKQKQWRYLRLWHQNTTNAC